MWNVPASSTDKQEEIFAWILRQNIVAERQAHNAGIVAKLQREGAALREQARHLKRMAPKPKKAKNTRNSAQKQKKGKGKPQTLENRAKMSNVLNGKNSAHNNRTLRNRRKRQRKKMQENKRKQLAKIRVYPISKKRHEEACCARFERKVAGSPEIGTMRHHEPTKQPIRSVITVGTEVPEAHTSVSE